MSDLFRNLGAQNASSSRNNTQWWADNEQSDQAKALRAKEAAGTLTPAEQIAINAMNGQKKKATEQGVEPSNAFSASTGVPDLTDKAAQAAKMSQALQLVSGRGRRSTMSNGEYGDSMLGGF